MEMPITLTARCLFPSIEKLQEVQDELEKGLKMVLDADNLPMLNATEHEVAIHTIWERFYDIQDELDEEAKKMLENIKNILRHTELEIFFTWFSETQQKDAIDWPHDEVAELIKEDLWPNPLKFFNSDAGEEDSDEDDDDEDNDDDMDEDDDEDGDE